MAAQLWNKAPFVRLLTALLTGIVLQWHLQLPCIVLILSFASSILIVIIYSLTALKLRYRLSVINGIFYVFAIDSFRCHSRCGSKIYEMITDWVGRQPASCRFCCCNH
jgi:hypothetical protein